MRSIIIGLIVALAISIGLHIYTYHTQFKKALADAAYWKQKDFKPDTVYSEKRYQDIIKPYYPDAVPPETVTEYVQAPTPNVKVSFDTLGFITVMDSIMNARTPISRGYFAQYPKANKFIGGKFTSDSITLDLLGIDGNIKTEHYPVDLSLYNYQYSDNSMRAMSLTTRRANNTTQKKSKFYNGTYVNYERDFINEINKATIRSNFDLGKFRLGLFGEQPFGDKTKFGAGASVGFRLF